MILAARDIPKDMGVNRLPGYEKPALRTRIVEPARQTGTLVKVLLEVPVRRQSLSPRIWENVVLRIEGCGGLLPP